MTIKHRENLEADVACYSRAWSAGTMNDWPAWCQLTSHSSLLSQSGACLKIALHPYTPALHWSNGAFQRLLSKFSCASVPGRSGWILNSYCGHCCLCFNQHDSDVAGRTGLLMMDISHGKENRCIPVFNQVDADKPPADLEYIRCLPHLI